MAPPDKPGLSWYSDSGGCSATDVALSVCYRVAFTLGDKADLGPFSPAGCKGFATTSGGCYHKPMFQSPGNPPADATAMKLFRVKPENENIGCFVETKKVGEGWTEDQKSFESRCPHFFHLANNNGSFLCQLYFVKL